MIIRCTEEHDTIALGTAEYSERKPMQVEAWYDRHTRLWCVERQDENGYQVGDATWCYGKKLAMQVKKELEQEL